MRTDVVPLAQSELASFWPKASSQALNLQQARCRPGVGSLDVDGRFAIRYCE